MKHTKRNSVTANDIVFNRAEDVRLQFSEIFVELWQLFPLQINQALSLFIVFLFYRSKESIAASSTTTDEPPTKMMKTDSGTSTAVQDLSFSKYENMKLFSNHVTEKAI